jgi:predicted Holliday junction resolvase-like endonuclease
MSKEEIQKEEKNHKSIFDEKDSKAGPIIGSVIIIIIILLGGLFFLDKMIKEKKQQIDLEKNTITETVNISETETEIEEATDQETELVE